MVIWVTGLSGAGKTTVCRLLYDRLKPSMPELVLLDGDAVREAFGGDLGYSEAERVQQVSRVQRIARLLSDQGLVVIVALVYARADLLAWNREHIAGYFEVLLDAPLELVQRRDPKGLYARARRGETRDLVGHDIPWHRPAASDLVLDVAYEPPPEMLADAIAGAVPRLSQNWKTQTSRG
jgi:adenylylsulfate kinase-like enzyme